MSSPYTSSATKPLYRATRIVWSLLYLIEALLALRFILKLFNADPAATFTAFIYNISYPLIAPFVSVFRTSVVSGITVEWSTILAMLFYALLAYGIIRLILTGRPVSIYEASDKLDKEDR